MGVLAAGACLLTAMGCGRGGKGAAYVDHIALPPDTMVTRMREPGAYGGRFVIGETSSPKTFNALLANEEPSNDVCNLLYASLTGTDNTTGEDTPAIAKSWDWSADGRTLVFHIRRGLRFSDGHPLDAYDVRFSYDVAMDDSLPTVGKDGLSYVDPATGAITRFTYDAPDSLTFRLTAPRRYAMMLAAAGTVRIMPRHVLEPLWRAGHFLDAYRVTTPPAQLVTSGAWRLAEYRPDERVVVERNPYWFGVDARGRRLPYLDQVVFPIVRSQNVASLKFLAGELDGLGNVRPEDYRSYEEQAAKGKFTLYDIGPSLNSNFLWFNLNLGTDAAGGATDGPPAVGRVKYAWFSNPVFRRAVSMAIDRDAIVRGPFRGYGVPNSQLCTPGNRMWHDTTVTAADYDTAGARRLLAGLGWRDRNGDGWLEDGGGHTIEFTIATNSDNNVRKEMLALVCDALGKVGIHAVAQPLDMSTLTVHTRSDHKYDACLLGLGSASPPDPGMYPNFIKSSGLTHYWHTRQPRPSTPAEARLDQLFDQNVYTTDIAVRHRTYREMSQLINDECWVVWMPTQLFRVPVRSRFGNVWPTPVPHRILWNIDCVYVKPGPGAS